MLIGDTDTGEDATAGRVHHIVEGLRPVVEGRNRRENGAALLSRLGHQAQMPQVQRRLPHHQDHRATFLDLHIRGACEQIGVVAVGDGAQRLDRAGRDDHAEGLERAGSNGRADVGGTIKGIDQGFDLFERVVGFLGNGEPGRRRNHDMRFDLGGVLQDFEQADAVDLAGGAGESEDEAFGHGRMV